ncbi:Interferon-induced protein 44-like [Actinomortierella ambigua]|nr:Interferon-induced protein 44-like [Actinomortierella ambigua]
MYTGKIEMTMDILAPVVDAAMELQLTQLVSACENYSCQEVGMKSVFEMLALADRHGLKKLWTAATSFFCIYAEKLLDTDDWQGLDRDVLTKVLSLDSIIAKELSVWSTVVRYAHHQNGYDHIDCPLLQFPKWPGRLLVKVDLDETDRGDASSTSDDNNDSHDDRSDHEDENGHRKTNDTADPKDMIVSLSRKQFLDLQDVIEHMLPAVRFTKLQRIYLATKDGFSTEDFHKYCDNQGPTLTVARTSTGYFFGGYNEASWFSDGKYHSGDTNFLFQYNPQTHLLLQATLRWHKHVNRALILICPAVTHARKS